MTSFCGNCGTQLRTGAKFCQTCGTRVQLSATSSLPPTLPMNAAPAAQPAPAPSLSTYEPPAYTPPQYSPVGLPAAEPRKSGSALKAVLITMTIFLVLVVGALGGLFYFVRTTMRNTRVDVGKNGVSASIGGSEVRVAADPETSEERLGVPIFQPSTPSRESVSISGRSSEGQGAIIVSTFTTDANMEKVANFYREKLGKDAKFVETHEGRKDSVVITVESEQGMRNIVITPDDKNQDKTKFVITSMTGTKSKVPPFPVIPPHPAPPLPPQ